MGNLDRFERTPLRPFAHLARRLWRRLFAWRCAWQMHRHFQDRARIVLESPDLERIPRVPDAGRIRGRAQVMHNGLLVRLGCYYGLGCVPFFRKTRGVHEPQEELAFATVLHQQPRGAVMLELGSYWAFYSMWFASAVLDARCFMVEPDKNNLEIGRANFALNRLEGEFLQAWVGQTSSEAPIGGAPTINVDSFCAQRNLDRLHLLHADIQGQEGEMLRGAQRMLSESRIDCLFVSTHGEPIHAECRALLADHRLRIVADVPPCRSYSIDGLIVAARETLPIPRIDLVLRP